MGVVGRGRLAGLLALTAAVATGTVPTGGAGATSESGPLDTGFGSGGKAVIAPPDGANEYGNALAALADGSLIVAGTAVPDPDALPGGPPQPRAPIPPEVPSLPSQPTLSRSLGSVFMLLRLLPDGRLDPDFGNRGRVWTDLYKAENPTVGDAVPDQYPIGSSGGYAMAVQDDGRIIVAGTTASTTSYAFALARYLPDGTLDDSFGEKGLVISEIDPLHPDAITTLLLTPNGRILAGGMSGQRAALARYHPDGTPDRSFGSDGVVFTKQGFLAAGALAVDPAGRIVAAGQGGILDGPYDFALARYQPDGVLDRAFGGTGVVITDLGGTGEGASGVSFGRDGSLVSAGFSSGGFALARHLRDGTLDTTFGKEGVVTSDGTAVAATGTGRAFLAAADGRMVMAGGRFGATSRDVAVAHYLPDGSRDVALGDNGLVTTDVVEAWDDEGAAVAMDPTLHKLVVAGTSYKDAGEKAQVFVIRYGSGQE